MLLFIITGYTGCLTKKMLSPEQKFLSAIVSLQSGSNLNQRLQRIISGNLDRECLANLAIQEGLGCILYKNLLKSDRLDILDLKQREKLKTLYYKTIRFNLSLIHDLKSLLTELNKHRIKIVLLQGISLLHQVYDDIGLRPLADIDLWVLKSDYPLLKSILLDQDYHKDPLYPLTFRKGTTTIDLHTHILWADRIQSRKLLIDQDPDDLFQRSQPVDIDGQRAFGLNRFDQVIYLGLHLLKHNAERLVWLVDIQNLVAGWKVSDWNVLLKRAKDLGQTKCVAYTCFLLHRLVGFRLYETIRLDLGELNTIEKKLLGQRIKKGSLPPWSTLYLFSSGKAIKKGGQLVFETLFPRPDILRQVFPDSSKLDIRRLYTRRIRQLLSMITSNS